MYLLVYSQVNLLCTNKDYYYIYISVKNQYSVFNYLH